MDSNRTEIWAEVPETKGQYYVSNLGRIKSVFAMRWCRWKNSCYRIDRESIVKPYDNGNGYKMVTFKVDGKRKVKYVHRLVAEAFVDNPEGKKCVNHIDYDRSNNVASNLEWCTVQENIKWSAPHMRKRKTKAFSVTGEQYIYYRAKNDRYRIVIDKHEYPSTKTLEEAVAFRDRILKGGGDSGEINH